MILLYVHDGKLSLLINKIKVYNKKKILKIIIII